MGRIARWIRAKIDKYITGIIVSRVNNEIQALLFGISGDDSPPLPEDRLFIVKKEGTGEYSIVGVLAESQGAEPGEKKLYSRDSNGEKKALIFLKKDGIIELNGNNDFAVKFNNLNTGLQAFIVDLNAKLTTAFAAVPVTWPGTSIDIDNSKVDEVKLP
jgi:hypothetical protein